MHDQVSPATLRPVVLPASLFLPLAGGAVLGIAVACLFGQPPWGDQALYLMAASKSLDGAKFGVDIIDVNPPLILWLSEVPVYLSRQFGVLPQTAMQAVIGILAALIVPWCLSIVRRSGDDAVFAERGPFAIWALFILILYATIIHPWYHLGTREQLLLLFVMPYLFLASRRLGAKSTASSQGEPEERPFPYWQAVLAGALAVAGLGLKPQHVLTVAALEALLLWRLGWHAALRPEVKGMITGGVVYFVAIVVVTPDYLFGVIPIAYEVYLERARVGWSALVSPSRAAKIIGVIAVWLVLRRRAASSALPDAFMVAGIGATAAYLLQRKGQEYQFVPALACFHMGLGCLLLGLITSRSDLAHRAARMHRARRTSSLKPAALVLLAASLALPVFHPWQVERAATHWRDVRKDARLAITAQIPPNSTVFMLSGSVGGLYDDLLRNRQEWGSRFTALWMLQALLTPKPGADAAKTAALAQWTLDGMVADLKRYDPQIILVDRCADPAFAPCPDFERQGVDLLGWFLRDPAFATAWAGYRRGGQVGPYDLWCSVGRPDVCRAVMPGAASSLDIRAAN